MPRMYVVNITKDFLYELDYEAYSGETSSFSKKSLKYDRASGFLYAFPNVISPFFDFIDLNLKPLRWQSYAFSPKYGLAL